MALGGSGDSLRITVPVAGARPRTAVIGPSAGRPARAHVVVEGPPLRGRAAADLERTIRHVLRLDEDLSGFYSVVSDDPDLAWVADGAGRMLRSPTVFEEVAKTVCTTNCSWAATTRMISALVEHLGDPAPGAPVSGPLGRAFPTAEAMADAGEPFYKDVARAGYRAPYLIEIARATADGSADLQALLDPALPDDEAERRLLALPGVGPYASAHVMLMIGRYSRLILDSWSLPKYARLVGRKSVSTKAIERRFRRYGTYAGLAFWMFVTRDWIPSD